jgi:hypothetical protein
MRGGGAAAACACAGELKAKQNRQANIHEVRRTTRDGLEPNDMAPLLCKPHSSPVRRDSSRESATRRDNSIRIEQILLAR